MKDYRKEILDKVIESQRLGGYYLFGNGATARAAEQYLCNYGIPLPRGYIVEDRYVHTEHADEILLSEFLKRGKTDILVEVALTYESVAEAIIEIFAKNGIEALHLRFTFSMNLERGAYDNAGVSTYLIDDLLEDYHENMNNFLKIDIEGSEMESLKGASKFIRRVLPDMAISIYHRRNDLILIPKFIESIASQEYVYKLRYYGETYRELVLYCERKHE